VATAHQCKDDSNHYNHCNINGHTEYMCWKIYSNFNQDNCKEAKKKNMLSMDLSNQVGSNSYVDKKIVCTIMQREVNMSSLHPKEENEMKRIIHINIQVKKTKVDTLFNSNLWVNVIVENLVIKLEFQDHDHSYPYPVGWVNKETKLKFTKNVRLDFQ